MRKFGTEKCSVKITDSISSALWIYNEKIRFFRRITSPKIVVGLFLQPNKLYPHKPEKQYAKYRDNDFQNIFECAEATKLYSHEPE